MDSNSTTLVGWISAIGSVATPLLLSILAGIGWTIQNRLQKRQAEEARLRERAQKLEEVMRQDRVAVYNEILEPFIILLTKEEGLSNERAFKGKTKAQVAQEKILSLSYKQSAFKLSLFASDNVVRSYNELMQFFYTNSSAQQQNLEIDRRVEGFKMLQLFGDLLLEIRKSVGNEGTHLNNTEMIEWLVTDIRELSKAMKTKNS